MVYFKISFLSSVVYQLLTFLSLSLLVLWITTDNAHHPLAADDSTLITDLLDGWTYFHMDI